MYLQFISVKAHCFHQKTLSLHNQFKCSLRHCRIKNWKKTRSFLIRSPFDTYPSQTSNNQDFTIREMILCGDLRFSHCQGHRYRPPREERDTTQHTAHARTGRIYRQTDGVRQDRQCHTLGTCTTEWEWGKGKDAYCNRLRPQKIQEFCIFQIINKLRTNKG